MMWKQEESARKKGKSVYGMALVELMISRRRGQKLSGRARERTPSRRFSDAIHCCFDLRQKQGIKGGDRKLKK